MIKGKFRILKKLLTTQKGLNFTESQHATNWNGDKI